MKNVSTSCFQRRRIALGRSACAGLAALALVGLGSTAFADKKPPLAPDTVAPFTTDSRISATARHHRRARELRASAGAFLAGQCELRHLRLCRAVGTGLALWPRRSRL